MAKVAYTNLSHAMALFYQHSAPAGAEVELIEQEDGLWTVSIDTDGLVESSFHELADSPAEGVLPLSSRLGRLSAKYESHGRCDAIGYDQNGGWSYGTYQIASRTGTLQRFIEFLRDNDQSDFGALAAVGGATAANLGTEEFKAVWKKLAQTLKFCDAQYMFIKSTHYDRLAKHLLSDLGLDLSVRTDALRDVAWSIAVQHGPDNPIFQRALAGKSVKNLTDSRIVDLVYDERSDIGRYFGSSTKEVREAVSQRLVEERKEAQLSLNSTV